MSIKNETWSRWNSLPTDERMNYIEHARMLVDRGYVILTDEDDEFDLALRCFESTLRDAVENKSS